ncbi:TIR domain-containing protein [Aliarcobacter sp. ERUVET-7]|uniref:TIR domain-containing protein n=1 Tax=Aliarcobacter sp. ERUVET-7 TaxID=3429683 RepID=UPI003D6C10BB
MAYRNGNYSAFYVAEPFSESGLGANATKDFVYYNMIRAWKGKDSSFPFIDSHDKNYNVRDGSDWETTLKPRLRERLRKSKNIVLFLSERTKNSKALREEIDYGINDQGLPVIVVYPDYDSKASLLEDGSLKKEIKNLWDNVPIFRDSMDKVPTLHIPMKQDIIKMALEDKELMVNSKIKHGCFHYKV